MIYYPSEEEINVALLSSTERWEENYKLALENKQFNIGSSYCALCYLFHGNGEASCLKCPLK